jgi:hypothetical protein
MVKTKRRRLSAWDSVHVKLIKEMRDRKDLDQGTRDDWTDGLTETLTKGRSLGDLNRISEALED